MTARKRGPWGSTRVAFLEVKDRIAKRLERGEPMKQIHRDLEMPMTYEQFTKLVKRHLPNASPYGSAAPPPPPPMIQAPPHQAGQGPETEPRRAPIKRFQPLTRTDPAAVKREDLI